MIRIKKNHLVYVKVIVFTLSIHNITDFLPLGGPRFTIVKTKLAQNKSAYSIKSHNIESMFNIKYVSHF